jgi:hypothetical protein
MIEGPYLEQRVRGRRGAQSAIEGTIKNKLAFCYVRFWADCVEEVGE